MEYIYIQSEYLLIYFFKSITDRYLYQQITKEQTDSVRDQLVKKVEHLKIR